MDFSRVNNYSQIDNSYYSFSNFRDNKDKTTELDTNKAAKEKQNEEKTKEEANTQAQKLKAADTKVRNHEMAHMSVGGQFAGSPVYTFQTGPDGQQYAIGGEVSIQISTGKTPEETVERMSQVRAAAMAPADPSPQDQAVAAKASSIAMKAMQEIAEKNENSGSNKEKKNYGDNKKLQNGFDEIGKQLEIYG